MEMGSEKEDKMGGKERKWENEIFKPSRFLDAASSK